MNELLKAFSADYQTARQRFRETASRLGWELESHSIGTVGHNAEELTIDVGCYEGDNSENVLIVSSGVHGVEGFFGSAVQIALLEQWISNGPPETKCLFLHSLNPFGFAHLRRFDENNVDPNRNFLLLGERFEGAPPNYARLDAFLNPRRAPSRWEPYTLKAMWLIARYGLPALRHAVAAGQYEYPRGLFYGGDGHCEMQQLLAENLPRWLAGSKRVVHLDFHTGLGASSDCKLLIDYPLSERHRGWLTDWFGPDSFESNESSRTAYDSRGGLGQWCVSRKLAPNYLFAVAEFGTYPAVQVLAGLRAENQAHHWGQPAAPSTIHAKERLKELFCPASDDWRSQVLTRSLELVRQTQQGLLG